MSYIIKLTIKYLLLLISAVHQPGRNIHKSGQQSVTRLLKRTQTGLINRLSFCHLLDLMGVLFLLHFHFCDLCRGSIFT